MTTTRREFLSTAAIAGGHFLSGPRTLIARRRRAVAPNDKVVVGVIGCNGMGYSNLAAILERDDVECAALCDVDRKVLERRSADLAERRPDDPEPQLYRDYRRLLDRRDIDAVIIGTPDHWHCLQMVDACSAGKDVYVEKPIANTIEEARLMVKAANRYDRVVQVGQWQRSNPHFQDALDYVWSGNLGRVRVVKAWAYMDWMKPIPVLADETPPEGVDYDLWLGPAPKRPFNANRFHFNFRWFWDYAGGLMTDWGVHLVDIALAGMKATAPRTVTASGGKMAYPDDASETPDTLQAVYDYGDFSLLWEHATGIGLGPYGRSHGIAFVGNNGTLVVDRSGWEVIPEVEKESGQPVSYKLEAVPARRASERGAIPHTSNFVDCIKSREMPLCPIETGALAAVNCHLGNIAFKVGEKLTWDEASGSFLGNARANRLLEAKYRKPWKLPKV